MNQVLFRVPLKFGSFPDGLPVYGFGMMLFLAFLLCVWLGGRRAVADRLTPDDAQSHAVVQDLAIWVFVGGLLGARITFLLLERVPPGEGAARFAPNFRWMVQRPGEFLVELVAIWDGGIVLYGSVLGALVAYGLAYRLSFRKQGVSTLRLCDVVAPSIALGVCLGRLGCFLNGCCYGQVACQECNAVYRVHFPLSAPARYDLTGAGLQTAAGFSIDPGSRDKAVVAGVEPASAAFAAGLRPGDVIEEADGRTVEGPESLDALLHPQYWPRGKADLTLKLEGKPAPVTFAPRTLGLHPTQLYEVVSMVLLMLLLMAFTPLKTRDGQVMAVLMICYAAHRTLNEMLRADDRPVGFESFGSLFLFLGGVVLLVWTWRHHPRRTAPGT